MSVARCGTLVSSVVSGARLLIRRHSNKSQVDVHNSRIPKKEILNKMYVAEERGSPYSPDYRIYFRDEQGPISPMHDIPLWVDRPAGIANMVVEIPRWTNAKMEICLSEPLNPVKQDVKKGALRFVHNVFPHRGYIWNYGALPQTWEDPKHVDSATGTHGDNDPIDVLEIGDRVADRGDVVQVKILGALAFIDEGETDWKLLAIDTRDPLCAQLHGTADIEREKPGLLRATAEWLALYKVPAGGARGDDPGPPLDRQRALEIVDQTHESWQTLFTSDADRGIRTESVSRAGACRMTRAAARDLVNAAPAFSEPQQIPTSVDRWYYLANL